MPKAQIRLPDLPGVQLPATSSSKSRNDKSVSPTSSDSQSPRVRRNTLDTGREKMVVRASDAGDGSTGLYPSATPGSINNSLFSRPSPLPTAPASNAVEDMKYNSSTYTFTPRGLPPVSKAMSMPPLPSSSALTSPLGSPSARSFTKGSSQAQHQQAADINMGGILLGAETAMAAFQQRGTVRAAADPSMSNRPGSGSLSRLPSTTRGREVQRASTLPPSAARLQTASSILPSPDRKRTTLTADTASGSSVLSLLKSLKHGGEMVGGGGGSGGAGGKPIQTHRRARSDPMPLLTGRQPQAVPAVAVPLIPGGAFVNIDEEEAPVVVDDAAAHARAREKWAMVLLAVKRMVKATAMFRLLHFDFLAVEPAKAKLPKIETFANHQIHMRLTKAHISRNNDDYVLLDRHVIKALPCMQRYTYDQRKQMYATSMSYEVHSKGTVMIKDGFQAESVYFILSGSVEVFKDHRGLKLKQNLVGAGEMFGELQASQLLTEGGQIRLANVICLSPCEFLRLDIDDYIRILFGHDGSDVDVRVVLLNSLPLFNEIHEVNLQKAAQNSIVRTYMPGDRLFYESDPCSYIYFVCKGTVRMTKTVRFLRTYLVPGDFGVGNQVVAPWNDDEGRMPRIGEEVFNREMYVCDVGAGMTLPELVLPKGLAVDPDRERKAEFLPRRTSGVGGGQKGLGTWKTIVAATSEGTNAGRASGAAGRRVSKLLQLGPTLTEEDKNASPCNLNAYAITFVECVVFPTSAFLQSATNEMVSQVLANNDLFRVSIPMLQETYIKWIVRNGTDPEDQSVDIGAPACGVQIGGAAVRQALLMKRPPPIQAHTSPTISSTPASATATSPGESSTTPLPSPKAPSQQANNPHPPASAAAAAILGRLHKQQPALSPIDSDLSDYSSDDESMPD